MKNYSRGFNVVELMVTVAIIGILASIAWPSYTSYVQRAHRNHAASCLMEFAQYMAQFRASHMRYDKTTAGVATTLPTLTCTTDSNLDSKYSFEFAEDYPTSSTFKINAKPTQTDAECGTLSIDNRGIKTITGTSTVDSCW